ncbi:MFS transporter [Deinococcus metallilatus]|uniref:MFS family permease n=1 Tax=Deinococcus metallilatus TaxID=1211322 RepID=A0AAJ5JZH6_9DEIO|nr:MFS transporter [Deinococcus metallilatus]MBB5296404.1 MFS family permease [Deinococcus metallilatus]QBY09924.1 MFS transporter [Deinococcus metallilatus]RXJ08648.1 MFS transporter [Deinococcus metallilatus]TLK25122.1 MFS transporter [Deinococcus metallilatus]GMA14683.1 MFS transporter [Deinococcus metallilatus]
MTLLPRLYHAYPRNFWLLWVGTLINRIGEFVVPLLGFYLTAQREMSVTQVSVILSALGVGRFFAEGFGGSLSDRYGTGFTMKLALIGGGLMLLLLAQARTFPQLFAGVLAYSLFTAMYKPAASTAVADMTSGAQRSRAYNLMYWAINVGASVAPVLGGWLSRFSFKLLFYLDAVTMFIYSALLVLFFRLPKRAHGSVKKTSLLPRDSLLWQFCVASLLYSLTYQSYKLLALVFAQQGFTAVQYGQVLSVNGLLVILLGLPIGHHVSRTSHPRWQVAGAALLGTGFLIHAVAQTFALHVLAVVVWTLGEIVAYSISKTIISELAAPAQRGTYIGLVGSMSGLATLIAPLLGGFLLAQAGATPMWLVIAGLGFAAALLFLVLEGQVTQRRSETLAMGD